MSDQDIPDTPPTPKKRNMNWSAIVGAGLLLTVIAAGGLAAWKFGLPSFGSDDQSEEIAKDDDAKGDRTPVGPTMPAPSVVGCSSTDPSSWPTGNGTTRYRGDTMKTWVTVNGDQWRLDPGDVTCAGGVLIFANSARPVSTMCFAQALDGTTRFKASDACPERECVQTPNSWSCTPDAVAHARQADHRTGATADLAVRVAEYGLKQNEGLEARIAALEAAK